MEMTVGVPVAGRAAICWLDPSPAFEYSPSAAAQTNWSLPQPTSVGVGVTLNSSVLPVAKVRTKTLPSRMYARRSPVSEIAGDEALSVAITAGVPPFTGTTLSAPLPSTKYTAAESAHH